MMRKLATAFAALAITCIAAAQTISLTSSGVSYQQNFNTLSNGSPSDVLPNGWYLLETGTNANTTYGVDNGTVLTGNTYSYGTTSSTDRALGSLQSGTVAPSFGAGFTNNTGVAITSLNIVYRGEMWRAGVTDRNAADILNFQISTDATSIATGTWTDVDQLDFSSPVISTTFGAKDGNDAAFSTNISYTITGLNIAAGATFYLRYVDFNIASNDDGLAIDDFQLTPNGTGGSPCTTPGSQPTSLQFTSTTSTTVQASFSAAITGADEYLVVMSTSATPGANPTDGTTYFEGDVIGSGSVVYRGTSTSFQVQNLQPSTQYYFYIFSVNSANCTGGPAYLTTSPLQGSATTQAPPACIAPTTTVTSLQLFSSSTSVSGNYTAAPSADGYLVLVSTNSNLNFTPVNGQTYAAGSTQGNGTVVKYGSGTSFSATGLANSTQYFVTIYSLSNFNCTGGPLYYGTPATGQISTTAGGTGIPAGYYDNAAGKSCSDLKTALSTIITNGMTPQIYGGLWNQYLISDVKPREVGTGSAQVIWDIYSDNPTGTDPYNFTPGTVSSGGQQDNGSAANTEGVLYNREHSVPLSWFSGNTGNPGPATDYHHIFPTDKWVNALRGSYIYGEVGTATTTTLNGSKLGSSALAGFSGPVFEPIDEYKGDVARAFLYFVTRYQSSMPGFTGGSNGTQAFDPTTYPSVDIPYLKLMLSWHTQDPVSQKEIDRNNAAYAYQGNRNPYVDVPDYANQVWNATCPGLAALPVQLISFGGRLHGSEVVLNWKVAREQQLKTYVVEFSVNGRDYKALGQVNATGLSEYSFKHEVGNQTGRRVYYRLVMVDTDGKEKRSAVFSVHLPVQMLFSVAPNPARESINLSFGSQLKGGTVQVVSASGKVMLMQSVAAGTTTLKLSTHGMSAGSYLVVVSSTDGARATQRIQVL